MTTLTKADRRRPIIIRSLTAYRQSRDLNIVFCDAILHIGPCGASIQTARHVAALRARANDIDLAVAQQ